MQPALDWGPAQQRQHVYETEVPLTPKSFEHQHFSFDGYEYRKVLCSNCADYSVQIRVSEHRPISRSSSVPEDEILTLEPLPVSPEKTTVSVICDPATDGETYICDKEKTRALLDNNKATIQDLRQKFFSESMEEEKSRTKSETSRTESEDATIV